MNTIEITKQEEIPTPKGTISASEHWRIHQVAFRTSFSYDYCYRILVANSRYNELVWQEYSRVCAEDEARRQQLVLIKNTLKSA